jgi:transcriptional regulator with XRE-family HTH domain
MQICVNVVKHIYVYVYLWGPMNHLSKLKLGNLVKQLRGNQTQKEFAKRLGVTHGAIQSWENGEVTPGSVNLSRIAREGGYTLTELMDYLEGNSKHSQTDSNISVERLVAEVRYMPAKDLAMLGRAVSDRLYAIAESVG